MMLATRTLAEQVGRVYLYAQTILDPIQVTRLVVREKIVGIYYPGVRSSSQDLPSLLAAPHHAKQDQYHDSCDLDRRSILLNFLLSFSPHVSNKSHTVQEFSHLITDP